MAWVKGFRYDAFLSYARIDDIADGWVERFYDRLSAYLTERLGAPAQIFKDTRQLDKNQRFDPVIMEALRDSAVLLTVISPSFQSSRYCRQEVLAFCESARNGIGLEVDDHHFRVYVLRFDVAFDEWFKEIGGITAFKFFNGTTKSHDPIDPDTDEGKALVRDLAHEIEGTLTLMKDVPRIPARKAVGSDTDELSVFLAPTYKSLCWVQDDLRDLLDSLEEPVTLPKAADLSDVALIDGFRAADVSVVTLDGRPEPNALRQLELAPVYAQQWILAVHPRVDLSRSGLDDYHDRLIAFRDAQGDTAGKRNYKFLHHQSDSEVTIDVAELRDEVIATLKEARRRRSSHDLMLDGNRCDLKILSEIEAYIEATHKHVNTRWASNGTPAEAYSNYEDLLEECLASMVVYGAIEKKWVTDRLDEVRKALRQRATLDKSFGVFYGPPPNDKEKFREIRFGKDAYKVLHDIDYTRNWKQEIDSFLLLAGF